MLTKDGTQQIQRRMFIVCLILLLQAPLQLQLLQAQPLSFNFKNFDNVSENDLHLTGNAAISTSDALLQLTSDRYASYGRAMKPQPLSFCLENSMLSFTTEFKFLIKSKDDSRNADGLTFFIAPSLKAPSNMSCCRWLGLFEPSDNGKLSNYLVGIEFDTYPNQEPNSYPEIQDIDGNHVGIDVNGITSVNASSLSRFGIELGGGRLLTTRIEYNASLQLLQVFVSQDIGPATENLSDMGNPVLQHGINLCGYIKNISYVGLSAGSGGGNIDFHNIYSWKFSSSFSRSTSLSSGLSPGLSPGLSLGLLKTSSFRTPFLVSVSLAGTAMLLLLLSCFFFLRDRIPTGKLRRKQTQSGEELVLLPREILYSDIVLATGNFSEGNLLGSGGFGSVYKGTLPGENSAIAVKRISENSSQGEQEFLAEVRIISSLSHRNLVKLRGWCREKNELILVYEFMPQGSLDQAIFKNSALLLLWSTRFKIICGLASAILYLHEEWEQQVIHRDIKCSNVMLDGEFNARLGDFGLARLLARDKTLAKTTNLAGTLGYIAPEIGYTYRFTSASDVYSFGIVALEIVSGKQVVSQEVLLLPWVEDQFQAGTPLNVVDPRLQQLFDPEEALRVLQTAVLCVSDDPLTRPSMRQVLHSLTGKITRRQQDNN